MRRTKSMWMMASAVIAGCGLVSGVVLGHGNQPGEATTKVGGGTVTVSYVGPSAQGRDVMSLIEPGSYWRMGADRATTLKTDVDLMFGDMKVPAGEYTLVAHFGEEGEWSLVVAESVSPPAWKPTKVVGKASGTVTELQESVDQMTIKLESQGNAGKLILEWGDRRLAAEFTAA